MHTIRTTCARPLAAALLMALALFAAGCEAIRDPSSNPSATVPGIAVPSPQPDHGPPNPQPPVEPQETAIVTVRAYAHAGGPEIALTFDFVATATQASGAIAPFEDPVTQQKVYAPQVYPLQQTRWTFTNRMGPGVVLTEFQIEALGVPPGFVITCTVTAETGEQIDHQIVTQSDPSGLRDLTLTCHHYPGR